MGRFQAFVTFQFAVILFIFMIHEQTTLLNDQRYNNSEVKKCSQFIVNQYIELAFFASCNLDLREKSPLCQFKSYYLYKVMCQLCDFLHIIRT